MKLTKTLFINCHRKILFYMVFLLGVLPLSSKPAEIKKLNLNVGDIYYYEVKEIRKTDKDDETQVVEWIQLKVINKADTLYKYGVYHFTKSEFRRFRVS